MENEIYQYILVRHLFPVLSTYTHDTVFSQGYFEINGSQFRNTSYCNETPTLKIQVS